VNRIIFVGIGSLLVAGVVVASQKVPYLRGVIENTPPLLSLENGQTGGFGSRQCVLNVSDEGSGLKSVKVQAHQAGQSIELLSKTFDGDKSASVPLELTIGKHFKEGSVKLVIEAVDASLRKNSASVSREIILDGAKPSIDIRTLQHVVAEGGAELLIFNVIDSNLEEVSVTIGDLSYPAFPANELDSSLPATEGLYAAFFALPFEYKKLGLSAAVVAKDSAGNVTKSVLSFRVDPKTQKDALMALKEEYLRAKAEELYPGYRAVLVAEGADVTKLDEADPAEKFRAINADYRPRLDAKLKEIARSSKLAKQWSEVFMKPMPSATSSTFGEKRNYKFGALDLGRSLHNGVDLAAVARHSVQAANNGVVVLAREFGIYGNTVMIDHGLGIFTLYGHLSSYDVKEGDKVTKAEKIGKTGQTGLAGGDHLHFEFRLFETPLTPIEWWDPKWITDNVEGKIADVKSQVVSRQ